MMIPASRTDNTKNQYNWTTAVGIASYQMYWYTTLILFKNEYIYVVKCRYPTSTETSAQITWFSTVAKYMTMSAGNGMLNYGINYIQYFLGCLSQTGWLQSVIGYQLLT